MYVYENKKKMKIMNVTNGKDEKIMYLWEYLHFMKTSTYSILYIFYVGIVHSVL
jgi:hypothetical protein